jgi:hypothetical protein
MTDPALDGSSSRGDGTSTNVRGLTTSTGGTVAPPEGGRSFRVLALDGGGVRGACTAAFLTRLEEGLDAPLARYFDLICGTSTGGILALGLATERPAAELLDLYRTRADALFRRRHPRLPKTLAMMVDSLYRSDDLHAELRAVLGDEATLGDAVTRVCVPAVNVTTGRANVFKTRHMADLERDHKLRMWRVAAATAAAPVYFDPVEIPGCGHYVDGGLWANTPATVGILEALRLGYDLGDVELLSVGTGAARFHRGVATGGRRFRKGGHHGLVGWGTDAVDLSMHAQTDRAENFMHYLLGARHRRVQFPLPDGSFKLDAVDQVETLVQMAFEEAKRSARSVRRRFLAAPVAPFVPVPPEQ